MTDDELDELLADCPTLFHMAERDSWASIRTLGLLSTTALLDRYQVADPVRTAIESQRRPNSITLQAPGLDPAVIRDQKPMDDQGLQRCLRDGLTPTDWYRTLNTKVFFWLSRDRLLRLLNARPYRLQAHDVLTLDARPLVVAYRDRIWLCPINSGSTRPFATPRGRQTFQRIADYPYDHWRERRKRGERVVELAIDHDVPDIARYVTRVVRMQGSEEREILYSAS